jgi:hypothetical protein
MGRLWHTDRYDWAMTDEHRNVSKPAIGILGAIAAIASVWWFAYRPRRRRDDESAE